MSTVLATDVLEADNVFTNRVVESMQVHYAETQAWYYLQDQQPSELLVFQQADSAKGKNSGMSDAVPWVEILGDDGVTDGLVKGCLTHRLRILWRGRTSCRERALKCGRWSPTVMLIEPYLLRQGNPQPVPRKTLLSSCTRFNSAILMLLPLSFSWKSTIWTGR